MKNKILLPIILFAGLMLASFSTCQVYGQTPQNKSSKQQTQKYTCTMHPEIGKDQLGKCPKCGMELVEKKDVSKGNKQKVKDPSMKHDNKTMECDSTKMGKSPMKKDSASMKHTQKSM